MDWMAGAYGEAYSKAWTFWIATRRIVSLARLTSALFLGPPLFITAWPATLLYRVWNTRTVAEAASVAAQEALGVAHSSRERLHGARKAVKTRWLLASAGLFKLRRNVEIAKEEERLAHAVAASRYTLQGKPYGALGVSVMHARFV